MVDTQRQADLAKIHLAKRQLRLDEASYRALLRQVTGLESAANMDSVARRKLLSHFRRLGFKTQRTSSLASPGQCRKIRWLWFELQRAGLVQNSSLRAMNRYIQRMTGTLSLNRLDITSASKVIEALKRWQERSTRNDS